MSSFDSRIKQTEYVKNKAEVEQRDLEQRLSELERDYLDKVAKLRNDHHKDQQALDQRLDLDLDAAERSHKFEAQRLAKRLEEAEHKARHLADELVQLQRDKSHEEHMAHQRSEKERLERKT